MFGTVFKMTVKAGKKDDVIAVMMDRTRIPAGMEAAYIYDGGGDELWGVAVFKDRASYVANAASPEQDAEFQKVRAMLTTDVEWHDGDIHAWKGNPD